MTRAWCRCALLVLAVLALSEISQGAEVSFLLGSERFTKSVKSLRDLRRTDVVMQALDFSCGAAALATVLRYGYADPVTETELIGYIFIFGQTPTEGFKKYFKRQGFTLLDLKRAARARGYQGIGYKGMNVDELLEFIEAERTPVLVPIRPMGYNHFVVARGIVGNKILLSDPALGNMSMTLERFLDIWIDGIGFIVKPKTVGSGTGSSDSLRVASDAALDEITAAGPTGPDPFGESAPSKTLLSPKPTDPPASIWRLQTFLQASIATDPPRIIQNTFTNDDHVNLITLFQVTAFTGTIQLGRPAGNFTDFSPPPGGSIRTR